jgi:hypothetical protein
MHATRYQSKSFPKKSKTYLIRENTVNTVIVKLDEPVQTFELVGVHLAMRRQVGRLLVHSNDTTLRLRRFEELRVLFGFGHSIFFASRSFFAMFAVGNHRTCIKIEIVFRMSNMQID